MTGLVHDPDQRIVELLAQVPELEQWGEIDRELPYVAFGDFALFLCEQARSGNENRGLLTRAFDVVNTMADSDDPEVLNLLVVAMLEVIADDEQGAEMARRWLNASGVALLGRVESGWSLPSAEQH